MGIGCGLLVTDEGALLVDCSVGPVFSFFSFLGLGVLTATIAESVFSDGGRGYSSS